MTSLSQKQVMENDADSGELCKGSVWRRSFAGRSGGCAHRHVEEIYDISKAFRACCLSHEHKAAAELYYVTEPDGAQKQKIKEFLCRKTGAAEVELTLVCKPELIGGFVLRAGDQEYDWSLKGRLERLRQKLTWR